MKIINKIKITEQNNLFHDVPALYLITAPANHTAHTVFASLTPRLLLLVCFPL